MSYFSEYAAMKADAHRTELFKSSGEKDGTRIFAVLNSNIKTLKTVGEYIETMYELTQYDAKHKQKNERVRAFNFRSIDNHFNARAIIRSKLIIEAKNEFGSYDNAFVSLLLYILLLDVEANNNVVTVGAQTFIDSLPVFIKRRLIDYAREIAHSDTFLVDNIYQQLVVLYGDSHVYSEFIEFIKDKYPDETTIKALFKSEADDPHSPITKRLVNFQRSALKKDALYTVIFYTLDQFVKKNKIHGLRTGLSVIDAEGFLISYFDYFNDVFDGTLKWLGKINSGDDIETLKMYVLTKMSNDQREEIYKCIQNAFNLALPEEK